MSAVATPPASLFNPGGATAREKKDFAAELRKQTVACRVHHEKLGVRKALTRDQIRLAAQSFAADGGSLTAAKRLIDTSDPAYRAVANVRSRASAYWRACTVPFPEPGIRLIRRGVIPLFVETMTSYRNELHAAAKELQAKYDELRRRAQEKLGDLFNAGDYPARIDVEFGLEWDFPSIEPPSYLKDVHPHLYEQEVQRIRGRFEEAVRLTEQAMLTKLHELVVHLTDRLGGGVEGKPKVFRDTAVQNLVEFFETFKAVDLGSNDELQQLVETCSAAVKGIAPDDLRTNEQLRASVAAQLGTVKETLDTLMVARPTRAISLEDDE